MPIDPAKPFDLTFTVGPKWDDTRLDLYLKGMVPAMSRAKIQKYIKRERIEVNDSARPANWRVRPGDNVVLRCNEPSEGADIGKYIPLDILYEDDDILAINKQPGLVVHPVALHRHDTLLNALYWRYKDLLPDDQNISLANRLDRNTSGLILVAKHVAAKQNLQEQFEARTPKKVYHALCEGLVKDDAGEIDLPIGSGIGASDKCKMCVRYDELGKLSQTNFSVLERFPVSANSGAAADGEGFTLLCLAPRTGRQHQLRVHTQAIGHPIVCDDRYGNPDALIVADSSASEGVASVARYALHAVELAFQHPATGAGITLTAPLAADITRVLAALRLGGESHREPLPSNGK